MALRTSGLVAGQIRDLFESGTTVGLTDGELLDRFVSSQGLAAESAFSALVDRHGPMVLGVCRRIVADRHAADDAFQATFLILARKARSIRVEETLGRWLYGVSRRVATREQALSARRPRPAGNSSEGWEGRREDDSLVELRSVLDEEMARLPRRSREVIALCHFEGLSFADAATRMGCAVGTVGSRLTRARGLLRSRLTRRGFAPAMVLAASTGARAEVPLALARVTARLVAAGPSATIPANVASLCLHSLRTTIMTKLKIAAAFSIAVGTLIARAGALQVPEPRPPAVKPSSVASKVSASTPTQNYEKLVRECRELLERESEARQKDKVAFQEFRRLHPKNIQDDFTARFLDFGRAHPRDPIAFDAFLWVAVFGFRTDAAEQAATLLARDHSRDPRLWPACQEMARGPICPAREILLRAIFQDNPDRILRGRAGLALAQHLMEQAQFVRLARLPGPGPYQARFYSPERMDQFRKLDDDAMAREAEEACERVIRDYFDIRPVKLERSPPMEWDARMVYGSRQDSEAAKGTLGELARSRLDEIQTLAIGKPAPEIDGNDDRDQPMKLSDFRGKVVLLTFSGDWCGPCVSMYPHERELVKRFEGRPFMLLSVNTDAKREELLKTIAAGTITWRCWWEPLGDGAGPIADRWHIRAWPTIFAIDHRGILRVKSNGTLNSGDQMQTGIDETIEALIKEAELDAR